MALFGSTHLDTLCILLLVGVYVSVEGDTKESYIIDTLVIYDQPAYNVWVNRQPANIPLSQRRENARESIKQYISLVIRQANLRLESLTDESNNWTIELSIANFSIGTDPLGGAVNQVTKSIAYQSALSTMKIWTGLKGYNDQYDYVILMTGYNLQGAASLPYDIKGIANIGTLCNTDGTSMSIVEDRSGGFQSVHFVAHEMGHSLGSKHDGESPNTACPEKDRYLMAINEEEVTSSNLLNPWYFSTCSKKTIGSNLVQNILSKYPSCLKESKPTAKEFADTADVLPGQVYDVRAQCRQLYGSESNVCLGENFKLSDVCTSMYCLDTSPGSGEFRCLENRAAEGSSCGTGKICQKGKCSESPSAPSTKFTDCFFGDATVRIDGSYSCSQYIGKRPMTCYQTNIRTACCESCKKIEKQSEACPYGDKKTGCTADFCKIIGVDGTRFEEDCCGTCGYDVIRKCEDVSRIDGWTCEQRVSLNNVQGCYNTSVAYHCCKTCAALRKNVSGCEYGDKLSGTTCRGLANDETSCQRYGQQCCQTCQNLDFSGGLALHCSLTSIVVMIAFGFLMSRYQ